MGKGTKSDTSILGSWGPENGLNGPFWAIVGQNECLCLHRNLNTLESEQGVWTKGPKAPFGTILILLSQLARWLEKENKELPLVSKKKY